MEDQVHGGIVCPIYNQQVLPNEEGRCSLCDESFEKSLVEIFDQRNKQSWQDGHDSAVHHIGLYGHSNLLTRGVRPVESYPVLTISKSDFMSRFEQYEGEDREIIKDEIKLVESLTPEEYAIVANNMCDLVWDAEVWDDAMDYALDKVRSYRGGELAGASL